jgi:glycosyltransferase involved in cell wall biosynthesis
MKSNRIIYYHTGFSSFVEKDIDILNSAYDVKIEYFDISKKSNLPFILIKQFCKLIFTKKGTVIVSQFAGFHTAIPSFFSKFKRIKSVIVLGGTDCVHFPSIKYGNYDRFFLKHFTKYSIKNANLLLPVDESLVYYKYTYHQNDFPFQGFEVFCGKTKNKVIVIHNGYDATKWGIGNQVREINSFVTIGARLNSRFGFQLKGIDLITNLARLNPTSKFYIIGGEDLSIEDKPSNLILQEKIPNKELNKYLQSKQFYLQLSISEGFPNALCEAMLSGCIPIVSNVGAMPSIVEGVGGVLKSKDILELDKLVKKIQLNSEIDFSELSLKSHRKIATDYILEERSQKFLSAIDNMFLSFNN